VGTGPESLLTPGPPLAEPAKAADAAAPPSSPPYEIQEANHPYLTQAEGEIQFNDELLDESVLDAMKKFFALLATNYSITTSEIAKTMRQDN
jgi:hypothetical protein